MLHRLPVWAPLVFRNSAGKLAVLSAPDIKIDGSGLAVTTDEAVMIGDSYTSDIAGAQAAGIDQIWIKGDGMNGLTDEGMTATYIVPKLTDIMNLL